MAGTAAADSLIARWDFEDSDLLVDVADAQNQERTITPNGTASFVTGDPGVAVSFTRLNDLEQSFVNFVVDVSGAETIRVSLSARASASASRYWKIQGDAPGEPATTSFLFVQGDGNWVSHAFEFSVPAGSGLFMFTIQPTDSAGDGSGEIVRADGSVNPDTPLSSSGTFRIDNLLIEAVLPEPENDAGIIDAGPGGGPLDAGLIDAGPVAPFEYGGLAITEVYFNPPSSAETGKEWIELANLTAEPIALDGTNIERLEGAGQAVARTATIQGSGIVLAPGERAVIAQTLDLDVGVCVGGAIVVVSTSELQLANSGTQWVRVTHGDWTNVVKYAGSGVPSIAEGRALALRNDRLDNSQPGNFAGSDCEYAAGFFGSPGVPNDDCTTAAVLPCEAPPADAGPTTDGGAVTPVPVFDAGPNEPPQVSLSAPNARTESAGSVQVIYSAADTDEGDLVEVTLYYDLDGGNYDGVRIASGLPAGEEQMYLWNTAGVPPGEYYIFAVARDLRGEAAYAYAAGSVVVGGGAANDTATLLMIEPDGINDEADTGLVTIRWDVAMPEGAVGNITLYYDSDGSGLDGTPIIAGLPVTADDGSPGPREYRWRVTEVPPGTYSVYGVLDWTRGQASSYAPGVVQVTAPGGCACASSSREAPWEMPLWALLGGAWFGLRRRGRRARPAP